MALRIALIKKGLNKPAMIAGIPNIIPIPVKQSKTPTGTRQPHPARSPPKKPKQPMPMRSVLSTPFGRFSVISHLTFTDLQTQQYTIEIEQDKAIRLTVSF